MRRKLPARRPAITQDLEINGKVHQLTMGYDPSHGRVAEVFIHGQKIGSDAEIAHHDLGVMLSLLLQHGATPQSLIDSLCKDERGRSVGMAGAIMKAVVKEAQEVQ